MRAKRSDQAQARGTRFGGPRRIDEAARDLDVARGTAHEADEIRGFTGNAQSKTLKGQGRKEKFPDVPDLLTYMKDTRRDEALLSTAGMIEFMWRINPEWMTSYLNDKDYGEVALERMVQRIAKRYGFTSQKPQEANNSYEELEETRAKFCLDFWPQYGDFCGGGIMNVDETAILFDMPPTKSWALKGRKDAARILGNNKHAGRMTAVLTIRDDGTKLPILFIIRGVPGGKIESEEFESYPSGHFYAMQESAWMDRSVWKFYVEKLLKYEVDRPTVLLLNNFDCHVSEEGQSLVAEQANDTVVPLPPNSTAVCQLLDVGVMGPLKAKLRNSAKTSGGTAKEKRLRAITATIKAWKSFKRKTIKRSFRKAIPRYPEVSI